MCNIGNHTWPRILTTFFNCGGNSEHNVESLIMILFSASLASLSPPFSLSLTGLLWSPLKDTCSNNFGTSCGSVWPSIINLQTIIDIFLLHNLWMVHNPDIKRLLYLFINFWISFFTMVCTWSFSRGDCNIPLIMTHCCSYVSI